MGNTCSSCESTSVVTTKLIFEDGKLEEFSNSIRVSQILQRNPRCFVCKADDMDFDEYVSAINENEYLQLGHLYFLLPSSWLSNPLSTEQMAALAVKASLALKMGTGDGDGCWCGILKKVDPVIDWTSKSTCSDHESSPMVAIHGISMVDPVIEWTSKSTCSDHETSPMMATHGMHRHREGGPFVVKRRGRRSSTEGRERKSTTKLSAIFEE